MLVPWRASISIPWAHRWLLPRFCGFQAEYNIGSPTTKCRGSNNVYVPCEQWFIRITDEATLTGDRPQVFFSGNLHGDEQVW